MQGEKPFPLLEDFLFDLTAKDVFLLHVKKHYFNQGFIHANKLSSAYGPKKFREKLTLPFEQIFENLSNKSFFGSPIRYISEEENAIRYEGAHYPWIINRHFFEHDDRKAKNKLDEVFSFDELYGGFYSQIFSNFGVNLLELMVQSRKFMLPMELDNLLRTKYDVPDWSAVAGWTLISEKLESDVTLEKTTVDEYDDSVKLHELLNNYSMRAQHKLVSLEDEKYIPIFLDDYEKAQVVASMNHINLLPLILEGVNAAWNGEDVPEVDCLKEIVQFNPSYISFMQYVVDAFGADLTQFYEQITPIYSIKENKRNFEKNKLVPTGEYLGRTIENIEY